MIPTHRTAWHDEPVASSSRPASLVLPDRRPEPPPALFANPTTGDVQVWQPTPAIHEETSATDRAWGLLIRQIPLALVWLILALAGGLAAWQFVAISGAAAALFGLTVFGSCCAVSFLVFDRQERDYSGAGLERHRINRAAELKRQELDHAYKLRRMALESYLEKIQHDH